MEPHTDHYRVRSYECTPDGRLRATQLLNYFQETASEHARLLGFDFPVIDEATGARGAWVLSQLRVRIDRAPRWRDTVAVTTFPYGVRSLTANRDFLFALEDGTPCGVASTRWMVIDPAARKAVRIPAYVASFDFAREPVFGPGDPFARLRPPAEAAAGETVRTYRVMRSHIDLNGHVNNVHYADWMLESMPDEAVRGRRVAELEIVFRSETLYGETVETISAPVGPDAWFHRVRAPGGTDHILATSRWTAAEE